jgi:hypothetical protein
MEAGGASRAADAGEQADMALEDLPAGCAAAPCASPALPRRSPVLMPLARLGAGPGGRVDRGGPADC